VVDPCRIQWRNSTAEPCNESKVENINVGHMIPSRSQLAKSWKCLEGRVEGTGNEARGIRFSEGYVFLTILRVVGMTSWHFMGNSRSSGTSIQAYPGWHGITNHVSSSYQLLSHVSRLISTSLLGRPTNISSRLAADAIARRGDLQATQARRTRSLKRNIHKKNSTEDNRLRYVQREITESQNQHLT
jgi:hypothetical protein